MLIIIRGEGAIDPAEFRRAVDARMLAERNGHLGEGPPRYRSEE